MLATAFGVLDSSTRAAHGRSGGLDNGCKLRRTANDNVTLFATRILLCFLFYFFSSFTFLDHYWREARRWVMTMESDLGLMEQRLKGNWGFRARTSGVKADKDSLLSTTRINGVLPFLNTLIVPRKAWFHRVIRALQKSQLQLHFFFIG